MKHNTKSRKGFKQIYKSKEKRTQNNWKCMKKGNKRHNKNIKGRREELERTTNELEQRRMLTISISQIVDNT